MAVPKHSEQTVALGIHVVQSLSYANAAARVAATGFVASDVGRVAVDLDTGLLFALRDHDPIQWSALANESVQGLICCFKGSCQNDGNPYSPIDYFAIGWETVLAFRFPGTDEITPEAFKAIIGRAGTTQACDVRLYDITNAQEVASINITASGVAIYADSSLANLPSSEAIFEVQSVKDSSQADDGYLYYVELK